MTGMIEPKPYSIREEQRLRERAMRNGYDIKFVSVETYRNYYAKMDINCFCFNCQHDFIGELINDSELNGVERQKYLHESGIYEKTKPANIKKKGARIFKIIDILVPKV